jgi:hypothetical protein
MHRLCILRPSRAAPPRAFGGATGPLVSGAIRIDGSHTSGEVDADDGGVTEGDYRKRDDEKPDYDSV